jgi:hypothetical protein
MFANGDFDQAIEYSLKAKKVFEILKLKQSPLYKVIIIQTMAIDDLHQVCCWSHFDLVQKKYIPQLLTSFERFAKWSQKDDLFVSVKAQMNEITHISL